MREPGWQAGGGHGQGGPGEPGGPSAVVLRRLEARDDRSRFNCGQPDLDGYFRRFAG